ncbi:MAG: hypothetical protein EOO23_05470 [Comamonadaceae bacterium]|nr:MAG: hypothetical protein EOO23_05470 [Comamonadaceae bacterium]
MNPLLPFSRTSRALSRLLLVFSCLLAANGAFAATKYEAEVAKWKAPEDVAKWLRANFIFDKGRQAQVQSQLKETGPENVLTRKPDTLFENRNGYCRDSAAFAKDALNKINPEYQARYIFIKNSAGPTNHWVTGYKVDNKLYVVDYGAGKHWSGMEGVHGPYASLDEYKAFLSSLSLKGFSAEQVRWRDIVGKED